MTRNDIITLPHPDLRKKSRRILTINDEVRELIQNMQDATLDWEAHRPYELGVALAAVQIDELYSAVIIRNNFDSRDDRSFFALINPEVVKLEGDITYDHEGCLSVRDVYGLVPRHEKVRVRALDIQGRKIRLKAEGFLARVLQHEIDHTNGIVFIDHIKDHDAFYTLTKQGELAKVSHEQIKKSDILWQRTAE